MDFNVKSLSMLRKQRCGLRKGARNRTGHDPGLECGSGVEALALTHKARHPGPVIIRLLKGAAPSPRASTACIPPETPLQWEVCPGEPCVILQKPAPGTGLSFCKAHGQPWVGPWSRDAPVLGKGSSHPQFGTGAVLLGRASCSSPFRECWHLTPQHFQVLANLSWAAKGTSRSFS